MTKKMTKNLLKSEGLKISFEKSLISYGNFLSRTSSNSFTPNRSVDSGFSFATKTMGQVIIEYFILFTIIAALTVIGLSTFFPKIQETFSAMQSSAVERIVNASN